MSPKKRYAIVSASGISGLIILYLVRALFFPDPIKHENIMDFKMLSGVIVLLTALTRTFDTLMNVASGFVVSIFHSPPRARIYRIKDDPPAFLFHTCVELLAWGGLSCCVIAALAHLHQSP